MRLGDLERVQQPGDVVGPDLHVVVLHRPVGLAVAAQVEVDHLEVLRQLGCRRREVEVAEAGAVDLHDGLALARDLVPELDAVDLAFAFHRPSRSVTAEYCTMSDIRGRSLLVSERFIERMTWPEVEAAIGAAWTRC